MDQKDTSPGGAPSTKAETVASCDAIAELWKPFVSDGFDQLLCDLQVEALETVPTPHALRSGTPHVTPPFIFSLFTQSGLTYRYLKVQVVRQTSQYQGQEGHKDGVGVRLATLLI